MNCPHVDLVKWFGISTGLLTPLIAIMAVYIARQQWVTNRRQLRLALFDRRMSVYNAAMALIVVAFQKATLDINDLQTFAYGIKDHEFLFGTDISAYLKLLRDKGWLLHKTNLTPTENAAEITDIMKWFLDQTTEAGKTFRKYMAFQNPE